MDDHEPVPGATRLTDEQAQALVLSTVSKHAESLLRVAYRHSLCADDAHDAYQRSMEILLRRAPTLDPHSAHKWLHVVVRHEAIQVRRSRDQVVAPEGIDYERHIAPEVSSPEERVLTVDRATRAAEALQRLKPQEIRAIWLKALGHSYAEIGSITGFSATKVNRCLTEGRKAFLERFEGIETGAECQRWQGVLSAIVDGEVTPQQMADVRPHLRNCQACRATLRGLQESAPPLAAVLPIGLVGLGAKLSGLVERFLPGGSDAAVGSGGAGLAGVGGLKLAGVLAAGAIAVGGGTAAVTHERGEHAGRPAAEAAASPPVRSTPIVRSAPASAPAPLRRAPARAASPRRAAAVARAKRDGRAETTRHSSTGSSTPSSAPEFKPLGDEAAAPPRAVRASTTSTSSPPASGRATQVDSSSGEFAPQP